MPRKRIGPDEPVPGAKRDLAEKLAAELTSSREAGQPVIYEKEFRTGKLRVVVIWDAWNGVPLQERTATIFWAYETAEGPQARERIALASGLTVPEAHEAGMLAYEVIAALRKGDRLTEEEVREALLEEGATQLGPPWRKVQLRFATEEEALAARQRLTRRFPGSDEVWIINREPAAHDYAGAAGGTTAEE